MPNIAAESSSRRQMRRPPPHPTPSSRLRTSTIEHRASTLADATILIAVAGEAATPLHCPWRGLLISTVRRSATEGVRGGGILAVGRRSALQFARRTHGTRVTGGGRWRMFAPPPSTHALGSSLLSPPRSSSTLSPDAIGNAQRPPDRGLPSSSRPRRPTRAADPAPLLRRCSGRDGNLIDQSTRERTDDPPRFTCNSCVAVRCCCSPTQAPSCTDRSHPSSSTRKCGPAASFVSRTPSSPSPPFPRVRTIRSGSATSSLPIRDGASDRGLKNARRRKRRRRDQANSAPACQRRRPNPNPQVRVPLFLPPPFRLGRIPWRRATLVCLNECLFHVHARRCSA